MYESYWGLKHRPFSACMEMQSVFRGRGYQVAALKLSYAIDRGNAAAVLTGECGVGKSFLMQSLMAECAEDHTCATLHPAQFNPLEFVADLAVSLGLEESTAATSRLDVVLRQVSRRIQDLTKEGRSPVICIEDADQIADHGVFHACQTLLAMSQVDAGDLTLIFAGNPGLLGRLRRIPPLDTLVCVKSLLTALDETETADYVRHRVTIAAGDAGIFDDSALVAISAHSAGVPRRINHLCDLALVVAFAEQLKTITADVIEGVATELTLGNAA